MSKDTVRFDAFVAELRALEVRHGLYIGADHYEIYVDDGAAADIRNDIELPPPPIPGDVPHEVITAVFENHVRHRELPQHWLGTILRVHFGENTSALYRDDFPHRAAIRNMMGQVVSFGTQHREAKMLAIRASCEGPKHWASFLKVRTQWFDAAQFKPYHVGVYEVCALSYIKNMYSQWNGVYWTAMGHDAIEAASEHRPSKWVEQPGSMFRGLVFQP